MKEEYKIQKLTQNEIDLAVSLFAAKVSLTSPEYFNRCLEVLWNKASIKGYTKDGSKCLVFHLPKTQALKNYSYLSIEYLVAPNDRDNQAFAIIAQDQCESPNCIQWCRDAATHHYVLFEPDGSFGEYAAYPYLGEPFQKSISAKSQWLPVERTSALALKLQAMVEEDSRAGNGEAIDETTAITRYKRWWGAMIMAMHITDDIFGGTPEWFKDRNQVITSVAEVILDKADHYSIHRTKQPKQRHL